MASYELIYFPVRGLGEAIRLLFADKGVTYKETMCGEDWPSVKPKMAFGQVPALVDGDFQLVQSGAILRYLARRHGLYGSNEKEQALIDQLNDGVAELRVLYVRLIYRNYEEGKAEFIKELPGKLENFEKLLKASGAGDSGFAVGGKCSFVDYNLFDLLDILQVLSPGCLAAFPSVSAFYNKVLNRPGILTYRQSEGFLKRPINGNGKQ